MGRLTVTEIPCFYESAEACGSYSWWDGFLVTNVIFPVSDRKGFI